MHTGAPPLGASVGPPVSVTGIRSSPTGTHTHRIHIVGTQKHHANHDNTAGYNIYSPPAAAPPAMHMVYPPPPVPHLAFGSFQPLPALPMPGTGTVTHAFNTTQQNMMFHQTQQPMQRPYTTGNYIINPGQSPRYLSAVPPSPPMMPIDFYPPYPIPPPPPPSAFVAPAVPPRRGVTIPVAGGFYESPTISSTLRARIDSDDLRLTARAIDINSTAAHAISDASQRMTTPALTKLSTYCEKPRPTITLKKRPTSQQQPTRPHHTNIIATLNQSPLSTPRTPPMIDRHDYNGARSLTPLRLDALRPSTSISLSSNQSPRRLIPHERDSPNLTNPTSSHQLSPAPPNSANRQQHQHRHHRSISYQYAPSPPLTGQSSVPPAPGSVTPRSPIRPNLFSLSSLSSQPSSPPPVSFHPIGRSKRRLYRGPSGGGGSEEECKVAEPDDQTHQPAHHHAIETTHTRVAPHTSHARCDSSSSTSSVAPAAIDPSGTDTDDHPACDSATSSQSASTFTTPDHSRRASNSTATQSHVASKIDSSVVGLSLKDHDEKANVTPATPTEKPFSYLQPLITASAFQPSSSHRRTVSAATIDTVSLSALAAGGDEKSHSAMLLGSNLPSVPESGIALDASFTSSMIRAAASGGTGVDDGDDGSSVPSHSLHPSFSRDPSVQEGTLSLDTLKVESPPNPDPKQPFTMQTFWAMHDYAEEHPSAGSSDKDEHDDEEDGDDHTAPDGNQRDPNDDDDGTGCDDDVPDEFDSGPLVRPQPRARKLKPQPFQMLDDSDSSSDDDDPQRRRLNANLFPKRISQEDEDQAFADLMGKKKKTKKDTSKEGGTASNAPSAGTTATVVSQPAKKKKKEIPPSPSELLSQSLNQLARVQIAAEFALQKQKKSILSWFHKAQQGLKRQQAPNTIQETTANNANEEDANEEETNEKVGPEETRALEERVKKTERDLRVLKEAKKNKQLADQRNREELEARTKVFHMLGGDVAVDEAGLTPSSGAPIDSHPTTLFTSSQMVMSYIEIEQLIQAGSGALSVLQHLVKMEAAGGVKFDEPTQLVSAVKVLSLPMATTNIDLVRDEVAQAKLPARAQEFVLKHSEVELEVHRVMKLSKSRKRDSKRRSRALKLRAARAVTEKIDSGDNLVMVEEGTEANSTTPPAPSPVTGGSAAVTALPPPSAALISQMKAQQSLYEDQQAREQLLDRLTIQDNNVLFDGDQMMTPLQVEQLIEVGKGSKPTLRHIVQMEVEKVKFQDPTQLISAVTVLTIPAELEYNEEIVTMDMIAAEVSKRNLPDSAEQYVLKHSEVDIEMHKVELVMRRRSGKQLEWLIDHAGDVGNGKSLTSSGAIRFRTSPKQASVIQASDLPAMDESTSLTVEFVDSSLYDPSNPPPLLTEDDHARERLRIEDELARREVHKRLLPSSASLDPASASKPGDASRRTSRLFVEGSVPMTPTQVDKLIEVGKGSKPTLRHIVQMEVEKVQFQDPIQLITAVKVLSVPIQSTNFNLERIEQEITQGRVKLPSSAVEYVMKHSEVQLEMHQVERIGLEMSGHAGSMKDMMATILNPAQAKTAKVIEQDMFDDELLMFEEEDGIVDESPEQMEKLRDEVARAEVHLRLENARSKLFKVPDVVMSSVQVDELIEEGNGGQPTLRHIVEMEVDELQFDSPQQLITAVKVMNLPTNAKRHSGPSTHELDREVRTINASAAAAPSVGVNITQQDVANAAAQAHLPKKIVEYVLKHSEVQLEMAKVVPIRVEAKMVQLTTLDSDDLFAEELDNDASALDTGTNHVAHMRKKIHAMEREMKILQADADDDAMMAEWVVADEAELKVEEVNAQPQSAPSPTAPTMLSVPASTSLASRRTSLVSFPMTPDVAEALIEESQAGEYVVTHLEKLARDVDAKPFSTKEELVHAVAQEHAAYMEVEEHARIDLHHRLEHDRPTSVFKLGARMVPDQVEHLIEEGHGAVPTLKHIVRMEHSNIKFKEPAELVSAVSVLSQSLESATLESVSHSVLAAHLPPEATKFVLKHMAQEFQMFEVDVEEVLVEEGGSNTGGTPAAISIKHQAKVIELPPYSSPSPGPMGISPDATLESLPHRRSLVAHPRVLSPSQDLFEEEVGRRSQSSSRLAQFEEITNPRRIARNSGQLAPMTMATPTYLQAAGMSNSLHAPSAHRLLLQQQAVPKPTRHSLNPPGSAAGSIIQLGGSHPTSLNSTMIKHPYRKSLKFYPSSGSLNPSPSPTHGSSAAHQLTMPIVAPVRREGELMMVDDDPILYGGPSRSVSVLDSNSRRHSAHGVVSAQPQLISLKPVSQQPSPALSMHNTLNRAHLAQVMAEEAAREERLAEHGQVSFEAMRLSPTSDSHEARASPIMVVHSPTPNDNELNMHTTPSSSSSTVASTPVHLNTTGGSGNTSISADSHSLPRVLQLRTPSPNQPNVRVLNLHPLTIPVHRTQPASESPTSPNSGFGPAATIELRPIEATIRRTSLTTPIHATSKELQPVGDSDHANPSVSPVASRSPSSLGQRPSIKLVSPNVLAVPSSQSVIGASPLVRADPAGSGSTTPVRGSPAHSPVLAPFTVMVTEASRQGSRATTPNLKHTPTMPDASMREIALPPPIEIPPPLTPVEPVASPIAASEPVDVSSSAPLLTDSGSRAETELRSETSSAAAAAKVEPVVAPQTSTRAPIELEHDMSSLESATQQLHGFMLATPAEMKAAGINIEPSNATQTAAPVTPASPQSDARSLPGSPSPLSHSPLHGAASPPVGPTNSVAPPAVSRRHTPSEGSPKQTPSPRLSHGSSPHRTSPHSSPPISRMASVAGLHSSPRASKRSILASAEKQAKSRSSPRTTPKSSPSQSIHPSPMHSLTVTPIASPRSSGGSQAYTNMAAAVSRSRSGLSSPAGVVTRVAPPSPLSSSSSSAISTLNVPSKADRRGGSSGGSMSGIPLTDVPEMEDTNTAHAATTSIDAQTPNQTTTQPTNAIVSKDSAPSSLNTSARSSAYHGTASTPASPAPSAAVDDAARVEIDRRKVEILSLNSAPALTPTPSSGSLLHLGIPTASGSNPSSKRGSRRNNTVADWTPDNEEEMMRISKAATKKSTGTKQHRKAGSVLTASYLQPTLSSSGVAHIPNTRDPNSSQSQDRPDRSNSSTSAGYTPSFLQPTQSHALKAARKPIVSVKPTATSAKSRPRRKESKLFSDAPLAEELYESSSATASVRHRRQGSTDEPNADFDEDASSTPATVATPAHTTTNSIELERTTSLERVQEQPHKDDHDDNSAKVDDSDSAFKDKDVVRKDGSTPSGGRSGAFSATATGTSSTPSGRRPWQPSQSMFGNNAASATGATDAKPKHVTRAPTLTEEELKHQSELEAKRLENERRRVAKLAEEARLLALANDPAEQLRLRREKRKNEFRDRKLAEGIAEEKRQKAEAQRIREEELRKAAETELAERLEAERIAAEDRQRAEMRQQAKAAKEFEFKQRVIAEHERKRAEAAEAQKLADEAERIANMPKYLATGTVAAVARMLDTQKLRNGQTAAEYLDAMRQRSELLREKAAANKRQLEQVKLHGLHEREDALAAHIAEIRKNKAELYESAQLDLQLSTAEKDAKAQDALRLLKEQSEAEIAAKHRELELKIVAVQTKLHANENDRARELEQIHREHQEEAQRKAQEVTMKFERIKREKEEANAYMLQRAQDLKLQYEAHAEDEMRALVESREQMREKASLQSTAYTPKVGIEYFAENDLLHLAGLPANHPMMLQAGVSRLDENGNAVWAATGTNNFVVTNVGSSAPATFAQPGSAAANATQEESLGYQRGERAGLDSQKFSPLRSFRTMTESGIESYSTKHK